MISIKVHGDFKNTDKMFAKLKSDSFIKVLDHYGQLGVDALAQATPIDSGVTADSWGYKIVYGNEYVSVVWTNSNRNKGVPIAIILQYGHGTGTGGYVEGRDYINPAMRPIFDKIAEEAWKEVLG